MPKSKTSFALFSIYVNTTPHLSKELYGSIAVVGSAFCFYLATATVRWATSKEVALNSQVLVFTRFLLGFLVIGSSLLIKRKIPRPCQYRFLLGRAFFNTLAVALFFKAIVVTTVAQSNILNMTYPIFIAIISWIFLREQRNVMVLVMTIAAFCGILLVLSPGKLHIEWESLWGLASGIAAAISITFLNLTRKHNDTETILLIVFGLGSLLLYTAFWKHIYIPNHIQLLYLVLCASTGILGQYLLTLGFRYVSAVEGGIISSIRILLAAILGPYITSDPGLTFSGWIGAGVILGVNIYFITHKLRIL